MSASSGCDRFACGHERVTRKADAAGAYFSDMGPQNWGVLARGAGSPKALAMALDVGRFGQCSAWLVRKGLHMLAAALTLSLSLAVALVQKSPIEPTAKWAVSFADSQCAAFREFGTPAKPLTLALKMSPVGNAIQLSIIRSGGRVMPQQIVGSLSIGNSPRIVSSMLLFSPHGETSRVYQFNLSGDEFEAFRAAESLTVRAKTFDQTFALTQLESLFLVLDRCVGRLRANWNIDETEEAEPRLAIRAAGNLSGIIRNSDYPAVAVAAGVSGSVKFVLLIDEAGKVADCTVIEHSGVAALDVQSCLLIRERAAFQPAVGVDGKPAKDWYVQRIVWRLE